MGKYDAVFNSEQTSSESLSPEEGVAAIAIVTGLSDSKVFDGEEVDLDYLATLIWETGVFDDYSDEEMLDMVNKLLDMAEQGGLGMLFNTAYDSLTDELLPDAFAAGVIMLIDDSGVIQPEQRGFLKELQQALELEDEEADAIIDEIITAFNEADEEVEEEE